MQRAMRLFCTFIALLVLGPLQAAAQSESYTLLDGRVVSGQPISYDERGVIIGGARDPRIPWDQFTQESLKQLRQQARSPRDAALVEPFIEEIVEARARKQQIVVHDAPRPERPAKAGLFQIFTVPLGLVILLLLYAANIYAGYEVALYRNQPAGLVCGVAAAAPLIGPVIFLAMPMRRYEPAEQPAPAHPEEAAVADDQYAAEMAEAEAAAQAAAAAEAAQPKLPPTVTFARGDFTFNRRFFETKLAGFLRVVPGEAEQEMVVIIKSSRGEFVGRRISQINQTELHLQTFKGSVSADEMIPFAEIREVQVRHKDAAGP